MEVKLDVKLNQANIQKIEQAMKNSLFLTMEALKTEVSNMQIVPKEVGDLEESMTVGMEDGVAFIQFDGPYARRLYFNPQYNFRQDKNPNAQGRWLDPFIYGDKKQWLMETYAKFLKEESGGVIK